MDINKRIPMLPPVKVGVRVSILAEAEDYNLRLMNVPEMWKRTMGKGVKIAVLDTGLPKHVDLNPAGGKSFIPGYLQDQNGHSTHCAGIIAAIANNGMGVKGIAPDAEVWFGAVLDGEGSGSIAQIVAGIKWAVDEVKADIISMSLGIAAGSGRIRELEAACQYAYDKGVAIFAAAGNEASAVGQPASYACVNAVAAVDSAKKVAYFSDFGPEVDFAAGGVDVFSTYLNNTYAKLSGTSMACPALAAVAALILADARLGANPRKLTPDELKAKLQKICFDIGGDGFDVKTGWGIPVFTGADIPDGPAQPVVPRPPKTPKSWWSRWMWW